MSRTFLAATSVAVALLAGCGSSSSNDPQTVAPGTLHLSATAYDFGPDVPGNALTHTVATLVNNGTNAAPLAPSLAGDASFTLAAASAGSCGSTLAPGASCDLIATYTAGAVAAGTSAVLSVGAFDRLGAPVTVQLSGQSVVLPAGDIVATSNPHVAQYVLRAPATGTWSVQFGPTASYGRTTPVQAAAGPGTPSTMYIAGMTANSVNHMRATLTFGNGVQISDADHAFTAGSSLPGVPASFPVTTAGTPQPGIELIDPIAGPVPSTAIATDLAGNVIWAYPFADTVANARLDPVKLLDNGHMLAMIAPLSYPPGVVSALNDLREFDLVGNTIRTLNVNTLNAELSTAGFALKADVFSHDFASLPNGHTLVIVTTDRTFTDLPGHPGALSVTGDAVIDLDASWKPVWVWNEFDHFDIHRQPYAFPDWTHSNSVAYSPDDGNFVVSMRHQNWIVKVNYKNGAGDGSLAWTMGEGGDFKLVNGTDPTDWFYAQHDAKFVAGKTAGVFRMTVMDNGDDRQFPPGVVCGSPGAPACFYTTIQEFEVDETAKTATLLFHQILTPDIYSFFAGNVELLANGNFEYTLSGVPAGSLLYEVTPGATLEAAPAAVWEMTLPGINTYRGFRMGSLYPGVQWAQ